MSKHNNKPQYLLSILENSLINTQELLRNFLLNVALDNQLRLAFGDDLDIAKANFLLGEFTKPNSSYLPKFEIRSSAEINGAKGAFAGVNNTIYLSEEFLIKNIDNIGNITAVILEEIGHAIDYQVNNLDAPGDEGEIFSDLVRGITLDESNLERLKTENDTVSVKLDGQIVQLEQANSNLGLLQGSWYVDDTVNYSDYEDSWTFKISTTGESTNYISVYSSSTSVDLILQLSDAFAGQTHLKYS